MINRKGRRKNWTKKIDSNHEEKVEVKGKETQSRSNRYKKSREEEVV